VKQILPGVFHWTRVHPKINIEVSSYYLAAERVLIDPLVPDEGLGSLSAEPRHILLTNRHHYRDSGQFQARFDCDVWCVETGLHEFTDGEKVTAFRFNQTLMGGILAIEIGALCPDETAFLIPKAEGLVALADGVVRREDGPLGPRSAPSAHPGRPRAHPPRDRSRLRERRFRWRRTRPVP